MSDLVKRLRADRTSNDKRMAADALERAQTALTDCKSDWSNDAERYRTDAVNKLKRIEQLELALREIVTASSGDDDDADAQHYIWIQDTAREALQSAGESDPAVAVGPNATGANALIVPVTGQDDENIDSD